MLAPVCAACGGEFVTVDDWDNRHSDADGEDVHEDCCAECKHIAAQGDPFFGGISSGQASEDELRMILSFVKGEE